jgi:hypothetical protein
MADNGLHEWAARKLRELLHRICALNALEFSQLARLSTEPLRGEEK